MRFIGHLLAIVIVARFANAQKLLVLFLDGFRWDYVNDGRLSGLAEMAREGAFVERVEPVFPADCQPNIYSIFTGLYPRHHGVAGNRVYSAVTRREFDHDNGLHRHTVHEWVDAEPLWVTARTQGKQSFVYHLPVCESSFSPLAPSHCVPHSRDDMPLSAFNRSVKEALRSLQSGAASMAVVYNDELDRLTHNYGPESAELTERLLPDIDAIIQWLMKAIRKIEGAHLVVLSDHGMAQIAYNRQIYLERFILRSYLERVINQGGHAGIWVRPGQYDDVYKRLSLACIDGDCHFKLYTRETMPSKWNTYSTSLSPDLLLVANPGYFISSNELQFPSGSYSYNSGWHGYAPEHDEMATPLFAFGPRVIPGSNLDKTHVTEIYQFLAHLLDIAPKAHNGSLSFLSSLSQHKAGTHLQFQIPSSRVNTETFSSINHILLFLFCLARWQFG